MIKGLLRVVAYIVVCVLLQVTVFNHIHLFNLMTPFLYLYAIAKIPAGFTRVQVIWMAFITGLLVDIFSGTLGIHAAASTLIGYYRNPLMHAFTDKEMLEDALVRYAGHGRLHEIYRLPDVPSSHGPVRHRVPLLVRSSLPTPSHRIQHCADYALPLCD